jgi:hypothetical protein
VRRNKKIYGPSGVKNHFGMSFAFESGAAGGVAGTAGTVGTGAASITLPDTVGRAVAM